MGKKSTISKKRESPSVKSCCLQRAAGSSTPATAFSEAFSSPAASPSPPTTVPVTSGSPVIVSLSQEVNSPAILPSPAMSPSPAISGLITESLAVTAPAGLTSSPETPPVAVASCIVDPAISPSTATGGSTVPGPTPAIGSIMGLMSAMPVASCMTAVSPSPATGPAGLSSSPVGPAVSLSPATDGSTIPGPTLATGSTNDQGFNVCSSFKHGSSLTVSGDRWFRHGSTVGVSGGGWVAPHTINNLLATASKNRRKNLRKLSNKLKQRAAALAAENQPAKAGVPATVIDSTMATGAVDAASKCEVEFGGSILHCDEKTRLECFRSGVFGLGTKKAHLVEKIRADTFLFLFDIQKKDLNGIYRATGNGGLNLEAEAFDVRFPAQCRSKQAACLPS